jgi:methylene-tetrahydromethanopterin dehydrogenase
MRRRAKAAMFKPFVVSLLTDPSGAFTTAAAMLACVEAALQRQHGAGLSGRRVLAVGGTGPVGRIAGVIAARCGAEVRLASRSGVETAGRAAQETASHFGVTLHGASNADAAALRAALAETEVVLACAAAGVQVVSADDLRHARALRVAADLNAVPPEGIAGVGVMDDGKPLGAGSPAVGIGALTVGNVKYQTQQRLLQRMRETDKPVDLGVDEAFAVAREVLAEAAAKAS